MKDLNEWSDPLVLFISSCILNSTNKEGFSKSKHEMHTELEGDIRPVRLNKKGPNCLCTPLSLKTAPCTTLKVLRLCFRQGDSLDFGSKLSKDVTKPHLVPGYTQVHQEAGALVEGPGVRWSKWIGSAMLAVFWMSSAFMLLTSPLSPSGLGLCPPAWFLRQSLPEVHEHEGLQKDAA